MENSSKESTPSVGICDILDAVVVTSLTVDRESSVVTSPKRLFEKGLLSLIKGKCVIFVGPVNLTNVPSALPHSKPSFFNAPVCISTISASISACGVILSSSFIVSSMIGKSLGIVVTIRLFVLLSITMLPSLLPSAPLEIR